MIGAKDFASPVVQQHKILSQLNPEATVEESTLSNASEKERSSVHWNQLWVSESDR